MDSNAENRKLGIQDDDVVYHEAGHAVAAAASGFPVEWVCVDQDRVAQLVGLQRAAYTKLGELDPDPLICPPSELTPERIALLHAAAVWLAAGEVAQRRGTGRTLRGGTATDWPMLERVFKRLRQIDAVPKGVSVHRWVNDATKSASDVIDDHWDGIQRVAAELKRERFLDGAALAELMRGGART